MIRYFVVEGRPVGFKSASRFRPMATYHGAEFRGARSVSAHSYRAYSDKHRKPVAARGGIFTLTRTKLFVFLALVLVAANLRGRILVRHR